MDRNSYLPQNIKQMLAIVLYVIFAVIAVFGTKLFLILLVLLHLSEYLLVSRKMADEKNIPQGNAFLHTLLYGFLWWKPIKEGKEEP